MIAAHQACRGVPARYHALMTGQQQAPRRPNGPRDATPLSVETKLFQGLADPARLRILLALRSGPMVPGALAAELGLTPSNTSNHLLCLLECGLLSVESRGRHNLYRLADPAVARLLDAGAALLDVVGAAIEECLSYGPPSRRALRPPSSSEQPDAPSITESPGPFTDRARQRSIASPTS